MATRRFRRTDDDGPGAGAAVATQDTPDADRAPEAEVPAGHAAATGERGLTDEERLAEAHRAGMRAGAARTLAQPFCLLVGAALVAAGVLGLLFGGSSFATGSNPPGDDFLAFNVNGWHNVVHIASGVFLMLMGVTAASAAIGALVFGAVYAAVAVLGFADGNDVLNLMAIDSADNWLHVGLAALGLVVGLGAGSLGLAARRGRRRAGLST